MKLPLKAPGRREDVRQFAPEKHASSPPELLLVAGEPFQLPQRFPLRRCPCRLMRTGCCTPGQYTRVEQYMSTVIFCGLLTM